MPDVASQKVNYQSQYNHINRNEIKIKMNQKIYTITIESKNHNFVLSKSYLLIKKQKLLLWFKIF
jgi:hypothetical protein